MHRAKEWGVLAAAAWLGAALAFDGARAELFRCTGPDGRTVFTDDKSVCPDAKPYQPDAVVHGVDPAPEPAADARRTRAALREQAQDAQAGEAQRWKSMKLAKQEELRQVLAERNSLKSYVAFCNHGNIVFQRDEAGIRNKVPCNQLSDRLAGLDARAEGIRNYLENELPEACRRAGCLPGWIR